MITRSSNQIVGVALATSLLVFSAAVQAQADATSKAESSKVEPAASSVGSDSGATSEETTRCCAACGRRWQAQKAADADPQGSSHHRRPGCRHGKAAGASDSEATDKVAPGRGKAHPHRGRGRHRGSAAARVEPARVDTVAGAGLGRGNQRGGGHGRHRSEMDTYRKLLENHASIERRFEEIPGGVRTLTTTSDPELLSTLLLHVEQMKNLIENGGRIRAWDPLFAEIFDNADKIEMTIERIDNGVAVVETSKDEAVAELIRAHARKVDQFVARGDDAYGEVTPLPKGYSPSR